MKEDRINYSFIIILIATLLCITILTCTMPFIYDELIVTSGRSIIYNANARETVGMIISYIGAIGTAGGFIISCSYLNCLLIGDDGEALYDIMMATALIGIFITLIGVIIYTV